jgi:hypothetical protein
MFTGACCIAGALWFTLELPKIGAVMQRVMYERIEQHLDREAPTFRGCSRGLRSGQ